MTTDKYNRWFDRKRVKFFGILILIAILLSPLCNYYDSVVEVWEACVDDTTGDIVVVVDKYGGSWLEKYSVDGTKLFSTLLPSQYGGLQLVFFEDDKLFVYYVRSNALLEYSSNGNLINTTIDKIDKEPFDSFDKWDKSIGKKVYELNGYRYEYRSTLFPRNITISIINIETDESVKIYDGKEAYDNW